MITERILANLKHKLHRRVKLTLELIEICSKNGNMGFHKALASKEFSEQFLVLLKRVRYGDNNGVATRENELAGEKVGIKREKARVGES